MIRYGCYRMCLVRGKEGMHTEFLWENSRKNVYFAYQEGIRLLINMDSIQILCATVKWTVLESWTITDFGMVDGRLGSRSRGYQPVAPRPISCRPFVHRLLAPPVISRGTPRQATWQTSVSEGWNYGRVMAGQFGLWFRLPRTSQGVFTCRKSAT
jgi:hypothetical protein